MAYLRRTTPTSRSQLEQHWREFGFRTPAITDRYETLKQGAELIASHLSALEPMLVDTKFEFGYAKDSARRASDLHGRGWD